MLKEKDRKRMNVHVTSSFDIATVAVQQQRRAASFNRMLVCWFLVAIITFTNAFLPSTVTAKDVWQQPGCHKIGHTRKISIPNCVEFYMTTNACRGYCESWAIPSGPKTSPTQPVTSVGQCCNMMETEKVSARVLCLDGVRDYQFLSAISCSCYHCKKD